MELYIISEQFYRWDEKRKKDEGEKKDIKENRNFVDLSPFRLKKELKIQVDLRLLRINHLKQNLQGFFIFYGWFEGSN